MFSDSHLTPAWHQDLDETLANLLACQEADWASGCKKLKAHQSHVHIQMQTTTLNILIRVFHHVCVGKHFIEDAAKEELQNLVSRCDLYSS